MYDIGSALFNGVKGYRQAEAENRIDDEYDYQKQKRVSDDAYQSQQRERNGVIEGRQDIKWKNAQDKKKAELLIAQGRYEASKAFKSGDSASLVKWLQENDTEEYANLNEGQFLDNGRFSMRFDNGQTPDLDEDELSSLMEQSFDPVGFYKRQTEAQARKQKLLDAEGAATFKASLVNPTKIDRTNSDGNVVSEYFQSGNLQRTEIGAEDPKITKAKNKKGLGGSGKASRVLRINGNTTTEASILSQYKADNLEKFTEFGMLREGESIEQYTEYFNSQVRPEFRITPDQTKVKLEVMSARDMLRQSRKGASPEAIEQALQKKFGDSYIPPASTAGVDTRVQGENSASLAQKTYELNVGKLGHDKTLAKIREKFPKFNPTRQIDAGKEKISLSKVGKPSRPLINGSTNVLKKDLKKWQSTLNDLTSKRGIRNKDKIKEAKKKIKQLTLSLEKTYKKKSAPVNQVNLRGYVNG